MKRPDIPTGVAPYFVHGSCDTVCFLYTAQGKYNNKLPESLNRLGEPLAIGVSHRNLADAPNVEKGDIIALGRAIKSYNNAIQYAREEALFEEDWLSDFMKYESVG